jgi:hypothetical protein
MNLYKIKPRYSIDTGKPIEPTIRVYGFVCDYNGSLIDTEDDSCKPLYWTTIKYDHSSEPLWYEDPERRILEEKYKIEYQEYAKFMESPYHFSPIECYGVSDASIELIEEWMKNREKRGSIFHNCNTIEQAFHVARLRTLMKLLNDKMFTPLQLGFVI